MAKYYATIAGLPNLTAEDRKLQLSCQMFVEQMQEEMTSKDRKLLDLLLFEKINPQLVQYLQDSATDEKPNRIGWGSCFVETDEVDALVHSIRTQEKKPKNLHLPEFWVTYLKERFSVKEEATDERTATQEQWDALAMEDDRLSMLYYEYLTNHKNRYIADWAVFNLNIRNLLSAYTCRKLGWDPNRYIVGNNPVADKIRTSKAKDFSITSEDIEYISLLMPIVAEEDITRRERLIDMVKWNWIEDYTFFAPFSVDVLLGYYAKLSIIERWITLNEETGEQTFRRIVTDLKSQCTDSLVEFRRNQKK